MVALLSEAKDRYQKALVFNNLHVYLSIAGFQTQKYIKYYIYNSYSLRFNLLTISSIPVLY